MQASQRYKIKEIAWGLSTPLSCEFEQRNIIFDFFYLFIIINSTIDGYLVEKNLLRRYFVHAQLFSLLRRQFGEYPPHCTDYLEYPCNFYLFGHFFRCPFFKG